MPKLNRKTSAPRSGRAKMLDWLLANIHLIEVHTDAAYCEVRRAPAASFRSLEYTRLGRPWSVKSESLKRLVKSIRCEMNHKHKWVGLPPIPGYDKERQCTLCGLRQVY